MVISLERGADLHMAQLMPLPLTVSCFSKIQIGYAFLVPAHPGSPGKRAVKRVCVCVRVIHLSGIHLEMFDCIGSSSHRRRLMLKTPLSLYCPTWLTCFFLEAHNSHLGWLLSGMT